MSKISEILRRIIETSQGQEEIYGIVGTVIEVNKEERTCTVTPTNGKADIQDVNLQGNISQSGGIVTFPEIDSFVIVSMLSKDNGYVSLFTDISSYEIVTGDKSFIIDAQGQVFNEGNNGGLINIQTLITELGKTNDTVNLIINAIENGVPIPQDGGVGYQASMKVILATADVGKFDSMEDETVKH